MASFDSFWRRTAPLRLLGYYYIGLTVIFLGLLSLMPSLLPYLPMGGLQSLAPVSLYDLAESASDPVAASIAEGLGAALKLFIALAGTLLLMLPVAWVYLGTRRRRDTRQSFVIGILMMPIVVTGVVTVVKVSLALAFSLAGIVAAVRFRNSLRDAADAIYIFAAIGIGLASGVGEIAMATVMSVFFNYLILVLWLFNFGLEAMDERWFSYDWMKRRPADNEEPEEQN